MFWQNALFRRDIVLWSQTSQNSAAVAFLTYARHEHPGTDLWELCDSFTLSGSVRRGHVGMDTKHHQWNYGHLQSGNHREVIQPTSLVSLKIIFGSKTHTQTAWCEGTGPWARLNVVRRQIVTVHISQMKMMFVACVVGTLFSKGKEIKCQVFAETKLLRLFKLFAAVVEQTTRIRCIMRKLSNECLDSASTELALALRWWWIASQKHCPDDGQNSNAQRDSKWTERTLLLPRRLLNQVGRMKIFLFRYLKWKQKIFCENGRARALELQS